MTKNKKIYLILDNIRSAYNVGSAFRTADGVGNTEIILTGISPYPPHTKLAKTALGSTLFVEWKYFKEIEDAIKHVKSQKIPIYGVENIPGKSTNYKETTYPKQLALIFGNEVNGISEKTLEKCDKIISIPMRGKKTSLNVATAIGIILYHLV